MSHDKRSTSHAATSPANGPKGRGVGTVIACFAAAIIIVGAFDDDEPRVNRAHARDAAFDNAAERERADTIPSDRLTYKINKGHVIIVPTEGEVQIDMDDHLRLMTSVKTIGLRTSINVDDDYDEDVKIKIAVPKADACRIELAAGLLEVKRLPCADNDLIVRSGKMDVSDVAKNHGLLAGDVSVGSVTINGANGKLSKSAGVGELHAELTGTKGGPTVTARVNVGMLTMGVD